MRDFRKSNDRRFNRDSDRSGRSDRGDRFGRRRPSGGFNRGDSGGFRRRGRREEKTMHRVTCDGCGEKCEVPFKPTDSKPVYCNDCFKGRGKGSSKPQGCNCKEELEKLDQKLELVLEIVKGLKTMHAPVEKPVEKKEKKPKTVKKAAAKKKPAKKKTTKKKAAKKK